MEGNSVRQLPCLALFPSMIRLNYDFIRLNLQFCHWFYFFLSQPNYDSTLSSNL
ncbi:hypothetical protein HanIR_Chr06g0263991 [Helianthus annuus]|nr:hypothetical protein HanIR_Chr06g0263991 [Helianthus annuus]